MSSRPIEKAQVEKVKFVYNKSDDLHEIYVNGAYGGINPKGELVCNFFFEHKDIPREEMMPVIEGKLQTDKATLRPKSQTKFKLSYEKLS